MEQRDYSPTKIPPQSLEAEQAVLGAILLDNNAIPEAQRLLPENYFYSEAHRLIFVAMLEIYAEQKKVDLILLSNALKAKGRLDKVGGTAYLASIVDNTASVVLLPQHAAILKKKAILRQLIGGSGELMNLAYNEQLPLEDILGQAQELMADLTKQSIASSQVQRLKMPLQHVLDYFANCRETPWSSVNEALGGLFEGEIIVTGGLPGVGKSTLAHAIMRHIAMEEGWPVAYFGPEMSPEKVYVRQLAAMTWIPENDIKRGRIKEGSQIEALEAASRKIDEAEIYREIVEDKISWFSLTAHVRKFVEMAKRPMGIVIVENLEQITYPGKQKGKETIDAVLGASRGFAKEMIAPVYYSHQMAEPAEGEKDRRPTMGDLFGTKTAQKIADKVILLYRPGYHPKDKVLKKSEPGEIIVTKGGPSIILPFTFFGSCFNWKEGQTSEP